MTTLGQLLNEPPATSESRGRRRFWTPVGRASTPEMVGSLSIREEQIHCLVQQLFFRNQAGPVRRVGFTPMDDSPLVGKLCLDVAKALVHEGKYEVGLIDAGTGSPSLQKLLQIAGPAIAHTRRAIAPRLWLAARESWNDGDRPATESSLERLRELTTEFDFSIVHCPRVSWLTTRIGHSCDGLVVVLTANKTRRLAAAQVKQQLAKAQVTLLGTVLAERSFPVPAGLYRSL